MEYVETDVEKQGTSCKMATASAGQSEDEASRSISSNTDTKPGTVFPFMSLPPELRVMVYQYVFDALREPKKGDTATAVEPTALFQICRVVRNEATSAFDKWLKPRVEEAGDKVEAYATAGMEEPAKYDLGTINQLSAAHSILCHLARRCIARQGIVGGYLWRYIGSKEEQECMEWCRK